MMVLNHARPIGLNALLPVLGLFLLGAAGAIAWVLSEPFADFLVLNLSGIPDTPEMQIVAGVIIFLVIVLLYGFLYAIFAPKPQQSVSEAQLDREKQQKLKEAQRAKKRKKEMRAKMRERNRN
jgi:uncharacterized ion transporter superfamily protein YfcC